MTNVELYFKLLILLIQLYNITSQTFEVTPVYPYCINGTAFISYLEDYNDNYLYFQDSFNDGCTYDYLKEEADVKYYQFESDINIINSENLLYYTVSDKNENSEMKISEIKDLNWKSIESLKIKKSNDDSNNADNHDWYYKIKNEDKKNSVLFRIAKNGNEKGSVSMYTLADKPEIVDEKPQGQENRGNDKEDKETDKFIIINSSNYLSKISNVLLTLMFYLVMN